MTNNVNKKTILSFTATSCFASLISLSLTIQCENIVGFIAVLITFAFSFVFIFLAIKNKINTKIKVLMSIFYFAMFLGMWFFLSFMHPMVSLYAVYVLILIIYINDNSVKRILLILCSGLIICCLGYDIFLRDMIPQVDSDILQKMISIIIVGCGIIFTVIINKSAYAKLVDILNEKTKIDYLTAAKNRKAFEEDFSKLEYNYMRYKSIFSVVFIDLNNFKKVNDLYGHQKGDIVLVDFVSFLKNHLRETDCVYRIGGDEFLIIMLNTEKEQAEEKIKEIQFKNKNKLYNNISIDFSYGVASIEEAIKRDLDIVKYVDTLMYKDKILKDKRH